MTLRTMAPWASTAQIAYPPRAAYPRSNITPEFPPIQWRKRPWIPPMYGLVSGPHGSCGCIPSGSGLHDDGVGVAGTTVGDGVGVGDGTTVGDGVGVAGGATVGDGVGVAVGALVGDSATVWGVGSAGREQPAANASTRPSTGAIRRTGTNSLSPSSIDGLVQRVSLILVYVETAASDSSQMVCGLPGGCVLGAGPYFLAARALSEPPTTQAAFVP